VARQQFDDDNTSHRVANDMGALDVQMVQQSHNGLLICFQAGVRACGQPISVDVALRQGFSTFACVMPAAPNALAGAQV
jgi:hypothetical protein